MRGLRMKFHPPKVYYKRLVFFTHNGATQIFERDLQVDLISTHSVDELEH